MSECRTCDYNDSDYGCTCPSYDKWYACPIEAEKPENVKAMNDYMEWLDKKKEEK